MKPKLHIAEALVLLAILLPYLYLVKIYNSLPARVPTHFGANGRPNDFSNKSSLWLIISLLAGVSILVYLLIRFLPNIDPKKKAKYSATVFNKIAVAIVLLMSLISCYAIYAAKAGTFKSGGFLPVVLGIFFAFMGNMMHSIKPNYFVGIRTPWTLESEETWRKTHQLGGKLWFTGGIIIAITGFLVPVNAEVFVMMSIIFTIALWPVIFSYTYFKSIEKKAG
ncbi:MAG TPA: SdpI family protein [Chitinophagaceae bacterium]|nr:SdpI family protein [Chitinophagaceae bacterium]